MLLIKLRKSSEIILKNTEINPFLQIATDGNYQDICEYIQRELQKVGFDCRIDLMPSSTLRQSRATAKLPVFRASWIADYPDAENYFSLFLQQKYSA
ncbi:ABC transporter substrate-binding protein [Capnocytophaga canimorsus]|nr:ABC transporter substrate-binding protein [Capnocytophaga canimorsus]WGU68074.1 ABC transporter substrate-binding protein [Capnocytophaga canimorsus]